MRFQDILYPKFFQLVSQLFSRACLADAHSFDKEFRAPEMDTFKIRIRQRLSESVSSFLFPFVSKVVAHSGVI